MPRAARRLTLSLPLVAAAAVVSMMSPSASAAGFPVHDDRGDVWGYDETEESFEAGSRPNVDLLRTTVSHTRATVTVRARYAALKRNGDWLAYVVRLRDDTGRKSVALVHAEPGQRRGTAELSRDNGRALPCGALKHSVDYAADRLTITVPRRCIGNPRWVQFQAASMAMVTTSPTFEYFLDDARSGGEVPRGWSRKVRRG